MATRKKAPGVFELVAETRAAYAKAMNAIHGERLRLMGVGNLRPSDLKEDIFISRSGIPHVVVTTEDGNIPGPYDESGERVRKAAQSVLRKKFGRGVQVEQWDDVVYIVTVKVGDVVAGTFHVPAKKSKRRTSKPKRRVSKNRRRTSRR